MAKDGTNTGSFRRSLFFTTAVITLATAITGMRPASAQSVSGTGDLSPDAATVQTPDWTVGADLVVGNVATGTLDIQNGGAVTNGAGFIGYSGQGTVTVSGADGSGNASTWTNNGDLVVGQDGNGTLVIQNGGRVSNADGYVGVAAASQSDVTVSGHDGSGHASTWTNTGTLYVGDNGKASLTIQDGGMVSSAMIVIGNDSDGNGTGTGTGAVTVTGRDINQHASTVDVTNQIYVGNGGTGNKLDVLDGGLVNSGQAIIGYGSGSEGTATVSGRDVDGNASAWNAANNIYVGFSGNGTLNRH